MKEADFYNNYDKLQTVELNKTNIMKLHESHPE